MARDIKASVVIPAYNAARTIEQTLHSLFAQTSKSFEIIVVDDGSTDETQEICGNLKKTSPVPMEVLSQSNKRQSAARNAGIAKAQGDYVIFLDADDMAECGYVEKLVEAIDNDPQLDIACCSFDLLYEDGRSRPRLIMEKAAGTVLKGKDSLVHILREELEVWLGSAIYRRMFLTDFNIFFDERITRGQDVEFRWRAFYHARKVAFVPELLVHYFQHSFSVTSGFDPGRFAPSSWIDPAEFLNYLTKHEEQDEMLFSVVRDEVVPLFTVRGLRNYILYDAGDIFWNALSDEKTRCALCRGVRMGLRDPGLALKCLLLLYMPRVFYERYAAQRIVLKRG